MTEFTVTITSKPLGITFGHTNENSLAIHTVEDNSLAYSLGLLTGDLLISINNTYVLNMTSSAVANLFNSQLTPFKLTFERFDSNYNSLSDTEENSINNINNMHDISSNITTPYSNQSTPYSNASNISTNYNYKDNDYEQASECSLSLDTKYSITSTLTSSIHIDSPKYNTKNKKCLSDLSPIITDLEFITLNENFITPFDKYEYEYNNCYDLIPDTDNEANNSDNDDEKYNCVIGIIDYINMFDKIKTFEYNNDKFMLFTSCYGFKYGIHTWSIKIINIDQKIQEIGVISNNNLNNININKNVLNTNEFGARAIYGNELMNKKNYYASVNTNGHVRINKDLSNVNIHKNGWCNGDIIKVVLDLDIGCVKFYINNKKVRKIISVQKSVIYYPFLAFAGNCKYELI